MGRLPVHCHNELPAGGSVRRAPTSCCGLRSRAPLLVVAFLVLAGVVACSGSEAEEGCGTYEVEGADGCECAEGYTRQDGRCIATNLTFPPEELPQQSGVDTPCTSPSDCSGFDADFCETVVSNTCLVSECDLTDPKACSEGHHCCPFPALDLPNLCVSAELSGGVCR